MLGRDLRLFGAFVIDAAPSRLASRMKACRIVSLPQRRDQVGDADRCRSGSTIALTRRAPSS
jgi:hypothetical protein